MSVFKKLQAARCELQRMTLKKSGNSKFAGYQYFELGDFLPAINDLFDKHGLCGVVSFAADVATLTIHDVDGEGTVQFTSPMGSAALKGCHEVQNIGAVETYQRRYLYVTALEIVEHDALEPVTGSPENKVKPIKDDEGPDKALHDATAQEYAESIEAIISGIRDGRLDSAAEEWFTLPEDVKQILWRAPTKGGKFSTKDREMMRSTEFREAYYGKSNA